MQYSDKADAFEEFFREVYEQALARAQANDEHRIIIDYTDLDKFDPDLAEELLEKPEESMNAADEALDRLSIVENPLNVRFAGLPEQTLVRIRDLRSEHISHMIAVEGIVKRASEIRPEVVSATFECTACGDTVHKEQDSAELKSPYKCDCGNRKFEVVDKELVDVQVITVEENPQHLEGSEQPRDIGIYLRGDLVNPEFQKNVTPGNEVVVTGILREAPQKKDSKMYDIYMDGNYVDPKEREFEDITITDEEKDEIKGLAEQDDVMDQIISSIAPSIYGHTRIKEAIALQMFSGVKKERPDGTRTRGDMHMLLIGEPGTGKSQMLKFAGKLAPKGKYVVGKSATGAGITATVVKDEMTDTWALEAGALVLSNHGLATIDEIDKMGEDDRSSMHEAMEQQSYHPESEILLADGRRVEIGPFVDSLMAGNTDEVIDGIDCEIMPVEGLGVHSIDLDTGDTTKIPVDRVSRHEAPENFIKVTFSNGRSVTVTPEHPMFVDDDGRIDTIDAENVEEGMFAPAPRKLPNSPDAVQLVDEPHQGVEKDIDLPEQMTPKIAELLGFLTAEGHSYAGSAHEIGFSNQDERLLDRMSSLMTDVFGMTSTDVTNSNGTVTQRWVSTKLYRWFQENFPEFMHRACDKRMPAKVLGASEEEIRRFLVGAFAGDGGVESESMAFSTISEGLAEDYADALAKIGVASRIHYDSSEDRWKTYIMGDSFEQFVETVVDPADDRHNAATEFVARGKANSRHHDVLPSNTAEELRELRNAVGLPLTGEYRQHIDNDYGLQVETVEKEIAQIREHIATIRKTLPGINTLRELRAVTGWSGQQLADRLPEQSVKTIHYAESGGYDQETRTELFEDAKIAVINCLETVESRLKSLETRKKLRYYRVTNVETIPNSGKDACEWVYDMTVEPTHTFVSQGVLLHNTISISKANIQATLQCETAILAAGNPKYGRFDPYQPIPEQINIGDTLLSRFDVIFPVRDIPDKEKDEKLAKHIMSMHTDPGEHRGEIDTELLRKYIAYAKSNVSPKWTENAEGVLQQFYVSLRAEGAEGPDGEKTVPITARQLEALIRIAESAAKARLSEKVEKKDSQRAIDLLTYSMKQIGVDPETGEFDIDRIESGVSSSERGRIQTVQRIVAQLQGGDKTGVPIDDVIAEAEEQGLSERAAEEALERLVKEGDMFKPDPDKVQQL